MICCCFSKVLKKINSHFLHLSVRFKEDIPSARTLALSSFQVCFTVTIRLLIVLTGVNDNPNPDEPPAKRRRVARGSPQGEWDDGNVSENSNSCETEHTVYTAELIVFDNNKHCLLTDGDYELALSEKHKRPGRKKGILSNRTSWENVFEGQVSSRGTLN